MKLKAARVPLVLASALLLAACPDDPDQPRVLTGAGTAPAGSCAAVALGREVLGRQLCRERPSSAATTATARSDMHIYGRLDFELTLLEPSAERAASGLWAAFLRELAPSTKHYLITVAPVLQDGDGIMPLGETVLFRLDDVDQNSGGGPRLSDQLRQTFSTPWTRLGNNSTLGYRILGRASRTQNANVSAQVSLAVDTLSLAGAGPTSGVSAVVGVLAKPAVAQLAERASSILNGAYSSQPETVAQLALGPGLSVGDDPMQFWRTDRLFVRTADGRDLAKLDVRLVMASTLASPERSFDVPSPEAGYRRVEANILPSLRLRTSVTSPPTPLADQISSQFHPPLENLRRTAILNPTNPSEFRAACREAQDYSEGRLELVRPDAIRVVYEVADRAGFGANVVLRDSGCLSEHRERLAQMIGGDPFRDTGTPAASSLTADELENIGKVMAGAQGANPPRAVRQFAPLVEVTAPPGVLARDAVLLTDVAAVDPVTLMGSLLRGIARTYHCFGIPSASTMTPQVLDRRMFVVLRENRVSPGAPIAPMLIRFRVDREQRGVAAVSVNQADLSVIEEACRNQPDSRAALITALQAITPPSQQLAGH